MNDEYICRAAPPDIVEYIKELKQQTERKNKVIQVLAERIYNMNDICEDRDDCPGTTGEQQCIDCIIRLARKQSLDSGE
jgi:hypothetical protein